MHVTLTTQTPSLATFLLDILQTDKSVSSHPASSTSTGAWRDIWHPNTSVYQPLEEGFKLWIFEGQDVANFLQRRTTQDIESLAVGAGCSFALLDRKAHVLCVAELYRVAPQTYIALVPEAQEAVFLQEIQAFKLVETFTLNPCPETYQPWLIGGMGMYQHWYMHPESTIAPQHLQQSAMLWEVTTGACHTLSTDSTDTATATLFANPHQALVLSQPFMLGGKLGVPLSVVLIPQAVACQTESACTTSPDTVRLKVDVSLWVNTLLPQYGVMYQAPFVLPHHFLHETPLVSETVSFQKGCYPGQETIARVKTYGRVPKAMAGFQVGWHHEDDATLMKTWLQAGDAVTLEAIDCGQEAIGTCIAMVTSCMNAELTLGFGEVLAAFRTPDETHIALALEPSDTQAGKTLAFDLTCYTLPCTLWDTTTLETLRAKALHLNLEGHTWQALMLLKTLVILYPHDEATLEALGVMMGRLEDATQARIPDALSQGLHLMDMLARLNPDNLMVHTNKSVYYLKLGDKDKAEEEKAKGTVKAFALKMKGFQSGQSTLASITPSETTEDASSQAILAQEDTQPTLTPERIEHLQQTITLLSQALTLYPEDILAHQGLADAYLTLERYAQARTHFEFCRDKQPQQLRFAEGLLSCYQALGERSLAQVLYQDTLALAAKRQDTQAQARLLAKAHVFAPSL
jgi:folate-binding protein YgfZ